MFHTLFGRFAALTLAFVILAEILILVPAIAAFRMDYLEARLERAQIASLALLANEGMVDPALEAELLANAEVLNVVLRRDAARELILSAPEIPPIAGTFDLRDPDAIGLVRDAFMRLMSRDEQVIRVIGAPVRAGGLEIEVTMETAPLRAAMVDFALRLLALSAVISAVTAVLLFFAVRYFLVAPMARVVGQIRIYADAPEDAGRIIAPNARLREVRGAEEALNRVQHQLTAALKQKDRLAQLGSAVAKISHDLRNILTTTSLMADRLEASDDPMVQRTTPKLMASLGRAVNLCETALAFGRAEEPPPNLQMVSAPALLSEAVEGEALAAQGAPVDFVTDAPEGLMLRCDPEQMLRVLTNLLRNSCQAIAQSGRAGRIELRAFADPSGLGCVIASRDTGPGLPKKALDHLFQPFQGGARKGGTGLGLAIAAELVRGHGGRLTLESTGPEGTEFRIFLPAEPARADLA